MQNSSNGLAHRVDALGWGLIFIWLGVYFAADWDREGLFSLGLGGILLFENGLRRYLHLSVSRFWTIMGFLFLCMGILEFYEIRLVPLLFVICGLAMLRKCLPRREIV